MLLRRSKRVALRGLTSRTGLGNDTVCPYPAVAESRTLGLVADLTHLGILTGCRPPAVFTYSSASLSGTAHAGLGSAAGCGSIAVGHRG